MSSYAYDPKLPTADMRRAKGLDRLKWIADRGIAAALESLYDGAQRNEEHGISRRFERAKELEERQRLIGVASSSLAGNHGEDARELAEGFFNRNVWEADLPRLREYMVQLNRLRIDVHSMPSRKSYGNKR